MKRDRIIYWIATALFSLIMLSSATMYFIKNADVSQLFEGFGFPTYLIYPLALAKILGVLAIVSNLSSFLKHLAYAGFFFEIILAFFAHFMIADGEWLGAILAMALLIVSYLFYKRLY